MAVWLGKAALIEVVPSLGALQIVMGGCARAFLPGGEMGAVLGIDYGLERVGLALSDPGRGVVFPLATLRLSDYGSRAALLDALAALALDRRVEIVVIGLPLDLNGCEKEMCRVVRNLVPRLRRRLDVPFYYMPEALSSVEAREDLRNTGLKGSKVKEVLDQQAACRILSSFLAQPQTRWRPA